VKRSPLPKSYCRSLFRTDFESTSRDFCAAQPSECLATGVTENASRMQQDRVSDVCSPDRGGT
jgi:hypothetical protein